MNDKLLHALSYFSILFFPVLIPLIIYMTSNKQTVKTHAKRAFISQCIPFIIFIINMLLIPTFFLQSRSANEQLFSFQLSIWQYAPLLLSFAYSVLYVVILVWNIFQGIRVLK